MKPVIVLAGRPNVGKSTLFNRLTRTRDALVADFPGLTRDRIYGSGTHDKKAFIVVDTGGLDPLKHGIEEKVSQQAHQAFADADIILFIVDGRDGLTMRDQVLSGQLRKTGKKIIAVVNKVDGLERQQLVDEFQQMGLGAPVAISASHGQGCKSLLDKVFSHFDVSADEEDEEADKKAIQVAIVGRPNVGKSTLINYLLGEDRLVTNDEAGTTRDSISVDLEVDGVAYVLVDTAGVRRSAKVTEKVEKFSIIKTLQSISDSNVVVFLVDASLGIVEQDMTLAGHIHDSGKGLVIVVNKWDSISGEARKKVCEEIERKLGFLSYAEILYASALKGSGVSQLLKRARSAYHNSMRNLKTGQLTRLLEKYIEKHQPPMSHGRRIKLRYAHQGDKNPPTIIVHGSQAEAVPAPYRRYLENSFIKDLALKGTPLRLFMRTADNPYDKKKKR